MQGGDLPVAHIDELYAVNGARMLSDDIMDGKALIRKLVALYHAASQLEDGTVIGTNAGGTVAAACSKCNRANVNLIDLSVAPAARGRAHV